MSTTTSAMFKFASSFLNSGGRDRDVGEAPPAAGPQVTPPNGPSASRALPKLFKRHSTGVSAQGGTASTSSQMPTVASRRESERSAEEDLPPSMTRGRALATAADEFSGMEILRRRGSAFIKSPIMQSAAAVGAGLAVPGGGTSAKAGGGSGRRPSIRLSVADVGFYLGKVASPQNISGETLRQAARDGNTNLCEALVRSAVPVDEADELGRTALMWAALGGHADAASHLVNVLGANLELRDAAGRTALALAAHAGKLAAVKVLLEAGADAHARDSEGRTVLNVALQQLEANFLQAAKAGTSTSSSTTVPTSYTQQADICRVLVDKHSALYSREGVAEPLLFLVDEWVRAKGASEALVIPPLEQVQQGKDALHKFFQQHTRRVNLLAGIKAVVVVLFIIFDLAMRQLEMTPLRLVTYVVLYVVAYYA